MTSIPNFLEQCDGYSEKLDKYYEDLAKWGQDEEDRKRMFNDKTLPEYNVKYQKIVEAYGVEHSKEFCRLADRV